MPQVTLELPEHLWEFAEDEGRTRGDGASAYVAQLLGEAEERRIARAAERLMAEAMESPSVPLTKEMKLELLARCRQPNVDAGHG